MCRGVLAALPEMSTRCDKPMPARWPPHRPGSVGVLTPDRTQSQEHATVTTTADRLPGRHHLVRGSRSLLGRGGAMSFTHYWRVELTQNLAIRLAKEGSWTEMRPHDGDKHLGSNLGSYTEVIRIH